MTLDITKDNGLPLNKTFTIDLTITKSLNSVTIDVPAFSFDVNQADVSYYYMSGGGVQTVEGLLPEDIRPQTLMWKTFSIDSETSVIAVDNSNVVLIPPVELSMWVCNDGALRILSTSVLQHCIPYGSYKVRPTSITYGIENKCTKSPHLIKNIRVTETPSNVLITSGSGRGLLEFYDISFHGGRFAVTYPENTNDPRDRVNQKVLTGHIQSNLTIVKEHDTFVIDAPEKVICTEHSVSINPINSDNIVATSIYRNLNLPNSDPQFRQGWRSVSMNGGLTYPISGPVTTFLTNTVVAVSDPSGIFDEFGNYWFSQMYTTVGSSFFGIGLSVSTDGGSTFTEVSFFQPPENYAADYPRLAFGGDGKGGKGLWLIFTEDEHNHPPYNYPVYTRIIFLPVTGLGQYDTGNMKNTIIDSTRYNNPTFTGSSPNPSDFKITACVVPVINVSPDGKVFIHGSTWDWPPYKTLSLIVNPTGAADLSPSSFSEPRAIADSNLIPSGGFYGRPKYYASARPIFTTSGWSGAFDPDNNRLFVGYATFVDASKSDLSTSSQDMRLLLVYSDNDGKSWKGPIPIADVTTNNRWQLNMSRDSDPDSDTYGYLLFSWFDTRRDVNLEGNYDIFIAVFNPSVLS